MATPTRPARTSVLATDPATIVLCEQDDELRRRMHNYLEPYGHRVLDVDSPSEAVQATKDRDADLVLLDLDFGGDHSWDLLDDLCQQSAVDTPVVLITPPEDDDAVLAGLRHGAHDQVSKPVRSASLLARVEAALKAKRLQDRLTAERRLAQQLSGVDSITGMPSRRRMEEVLVQTTATARRYGHSLSVILADLDHFTRINDIHGTEAGNQVLQEVGVHINADLRISDIAGRWGDDEFLLILPHTPVDGATVLADRLRMTLSEMPVRLPDGTPAAAPASFGCAEGADPIVMMQTATEMLRAAKRSGRNAVRSQPPSR